MISYKKLIKSLAYKRDFQVKIKEKKGCIIRMQPLKKSRLTVIRQVISVYYFILLCPASF